MYNKYYYLTASLPFLGFEKEERFASEDFIFECNKWLSQKDLTKIHTVDINNLHINPKDPGIVRDWKRFNKDLKEEIAKLRASRETQKIISSFREIFEEKTPLLMEKRFERIRWDYIERQEPFYHFDINWLMLYLFKIKINERLKEFDKGKGQFKFEEICKVSYGKE